MEGIAQHTKKSVDGVREDNKRETRYMIHKYYKEIVCERRDEINHWSSKRHVI